MLISSSLMPTYIIILYVCGGQLFRSFWMAHFYLVKKSTTVTGRNPSLSKHHLNTKCIVPAFLGGQVTDAV
jgi:hypothetical protein